MIIKHSVSQEEIKVVKQEQLPEWAMKSVRAKEALAATEDGTEAETDKSKIKLSSEED